MTQALKIKKLHPTVKEVEAVEWDGSKEMANAIIDWIADSSARFYTAAVTNDVALIVIDSYGLTIRPNDFIVKYPGGKLDVHSLGDGEYTEVDDYGLDYVEMGSSKAIERIKYIRAQSGCDLKQARDFVKYAPGIPGDHIVKCIKAFASKGISIDETAFPITHIALNVPRIPELHEKVFDSQGLLSEELVHVVKRANGNLNHLTPRNEVIAVLTVLTVLGVNHK